MLPTSGDEDYRQPSYPSASQLQCQQAGRLFTDGSFDDANIPESRYSGLLTIAHTTEVGEQAGLSGADSGGRGRSGPKRVNFAIFTRNPKATAPANRA